MKNLTILATTFAASTIGLNLIAGISKAEAASLVPPVEGEIQLTNVACLTGSCIDTVPYGYTVTSQNYNANYKPSLLFSDDSATPNSYGFGISFANPDAGTNTIAGENWFRPVAIKTDGTFPENGQLEVGVFKFDFTNTISELVLSFFDVEDIGTAILSVNGGAFAGTVTPGDNANIKKVTLTNVSSFEVKLGNIGGKFITGDGVRLDVNQTVPEPGTTISLGLLGLVALFGLQKRIKNSQTV
ncbi:LEVG family PEP-CTERM protein [Nostoc sp. 2RC]|uniref:LEVG family PEP-CTERM protein n=1 Tax=Nostoc sp. 2RC TaxID=2485484 RepID=UPI001626496C|nr:LEVG family PEP-CTERM protein [Nostoc sp. 2RC]MBC1238227.1 LEVG family PEP-CTERM protein [Nostoc sp. 2RC]MDZ8010115.1 LEVG family PEP-CTERM protein [Nostoc sp. ZfuVER08]